jgi:ABC-2 type transport system ATP-binding protein
LWSTAYLEEAERCAHIWLLDRGKLLYQGPPGELSARMQGRVFRRRVAAGQARPTAEAELERDVVLDAVIQGASVRVIAKADGVHEFSGSGYESVPPRLEDAYVELLGGARKGESLLARGWPTGGGSARSHGTPAREAPGGGSAHEGATHESSGHSGSAHDGTTHEASGRSGSAHEGAAREAAIHETAVHDGVLVRAAGLTKHFGDFVAADHVGFEVHAGEIYGLLGPNGAGKSTTFRMLCGLLKPSEGDASVAGVNLLHSASRARARLGYMAQKFSLYGDLSVAQNLAYFADIYGLNRQRKRERINAMVEAFELAPHLGSNASLLPLGFKQRLALACATLHAPAVLFLDEPTSGVDPLMRREFWHHINALTTKGVAVVVTTHFMEEAEYCDRIGLIWRGKKIAEGTPDDLKASVRSATSTEPTLEEAFITLIEREAA